MLASCPLHSHEKNLFLVRSKHTWHFNRVKIKTEDSLMTLHLFIYLFIWIPPLVLESVSNFWIFWKGCFRPYFCVLQLPSFSFSSTAFLNTSFFPLFPILCLSSVICIICFSHSFISCLLFSLNAKLSLDFKYLRSGLELQYVNPKLKTCQSSEYPNMAGERGLILYLYYNLLLLGQGMPTGVVCFLCSKNNYCLCDLINLHQ